MPPLTPNELLPYRSEGIEREDKASPPPFIAGLQYPDKTTQTLCALLNIGTSKTLHFD